MTLEPVGLPLNLWQDAGVCSPAIFYDRLSSGHHSKTTR